MSKREFTLMVKPVGARCNMRCRYCYYIGKGDMSAADIMSDKTLEKLIKQSVKAAPGNTLSIVWHGGEPTLAGLRFFRKVVELQRRYSPPGFSFINNLQTNGLLLDNEWLSFVAENHFDLGVSIDGSKCVHDANRLNASGAGTFSRVSEVITRALRMGIHADLLCTVNSETVKHPSEVFKTLCSFNAGWMQFIPVVAPPGTAMPEAITGEEYGDFLKAVFDLWISSELGKNDVQLFSELAYSVNGGESKVCYLKPECGDVPVIEADGSVYMCDHFVDRQHIIGNINNEPLGSLVDSKELFDFGSLKSNVTGECRRCAYIRYCRGGCLKDRYGESTDGESGHSVLCSAYKRFYLYAVPLIESLIRMSKNGFSQNAMMRRMSVKIQKN